MTTTMEVGEAILQCSALGVSRRGLLEQERVEGAHWRAGEIKEDGRMKIGTPTMNDNDNDQALLGLAGRLKGTTIAPITIPV